MKIENHTNDDKFYLYLEDEVEEFQLFKSQLSEACESAPPVTSLSGNAHNFIVGANIPFFGWVRCRVVEKITSQNAEVELLDHSDQLRRINVDQMVKLEDRFVEMRKRTISCKLLNPDLRVERLRVVARLSEGEFTAKFINEIEEGVFSVEIYSEGKLLNDTMRMEMDFTGRKSVYQSEPILVGALLDVQVCEINEENLPYCFPIFRSSELNVLEPLRFAKRQRSTIAFVILSTTSSKLTKHVRWICLLCESSTLATQ